MKQIIQYNAVEWVFILLSLSCIKHKFKYTIYIPLNEALSIPNNIADEFALN